MAVHKKKIEWNLIENENDRQVIADTMLKFILRMLWKMGKMLPLNNKFLNELTCLNPDKFYFDQWEKLGDRFSNIISEIDYPAFYHEIEKFEMNLDDLKSKFYIEIDEDVYQLYIDKEINKKFPMMCRLACSILSIPFSNADVERTFSQLSLIKTTRRNGLNNDTTEALVMSKIGLDLINLEDPETINNLAKKAIIYQKIKDDEKERLKKKRKAEKITSKMPKSNPQTYSASVPTENDKVDNVKKACLDRDDSELLSERPDLKRLRRCKIDEFVAEPEKMAIEKTILEVMPSILSDSPTHETELKIEAAKLAKSNY